MDGRADISDSHEEAGGALPGVPGSASFSTVVHSPSAIPVLIAAPHGGRSYPSSLLADLRGGDSTTLRLEDRLVDRLARAVAGQSGANLLVAHAPRAMIDLNRAPDDIDWDMFERESRPVGGGLPVSRRARSGLGLIPRRLPHSGELWRRKLVRADLDARIEGVHAPYHAALEAMLEDLRDRWGAALLIDLHSMPPLPRRAGAAAAQIVVGDRFGATCHGGIIAASFAHFARCGRDAAHNRPYAGGYVLERHGRPRAGIHAVQLEIDRSCYLDEALEAVGEGFDMMASDLVELVRMLAAMVGELGQPRSGSGWPLAAE